MTPGPRSDRRPLLLLLLVLFMTSPLALAPALASNGPLGEAGGQEESSEETADTEDDDEETDPDRDIGAADEGSDDASPSDSEPAQLPARRAVVVGRGALPGADAEGIEDVLAGEADPARAAELLQAADDGAGAGGALAPDATRRGRLAPMGVTLDAFLEKRAPEAFNMMPPEAVRPHAWCAPRSPPRPPPTTTTPARGTTCSRRA